MPLCLYKTTLPGWVHLSLIEFIIFNDIASIAIVKLSIIIFRGSFIGLTNRKTHVKCSLNISNFCCHGFKGEWYASMLIIKLE